MHHRQPTFPADQRDPNRVALSAHFYAIGEFGKFAHLAIGEAVLAWVVFGFGWKIFSCCCFEAIFPVGYR